MKSAIAVIVTARNLVAVLAGEGLEIKRGERVCRIQYGIETVVVIQIDFG